jgi:hypothetical protein
MTRGSQTAVAHRGSGPPSGLDRTEKTELCGHSIIETDLPRNLAVLDPQDPCSGEAHLASCCCRQRSDQEVSKSGPVCAPATFPATDDTIAFGDEIRGTPELKGRERFAETVMKALMFSRPRRGSRSEYCKSMSGLVDNAQIAGWTQNSVNRRPGRRRSILTFEI